MAEDPMMFFSKTIEEMSIYRDNLSFDFEANGINR